MDLIPDTELIQILKSYGETPPLRANRAQLLELVGGRLRKTYTPEDLIQLHFTASLDPNQTLAEVLAPKGKLYQYLQLQNRLTPSNRILMDQPEMEELIREGQDQALKGLETLRKQEAQIPQVYRNLTFAQLEQLMDTPENQVADAYTRAELSQMIPGKSTPISELAEKGILTSFLPTQIKSSGGIYYLLMSTPWTAGSRRPIYLEPEPFDPTQTNKYLQRALESAQVVDPSWSWNFPEPLRQELEDLAQSPPMEKGRRRYRQEYRFEEYSRLRSQPREILEDLAAYLGTPKDQAQLLDFPSLIFLLTRRELPLGLNWSEIQSRTSKISPDQVEFLQNYLNSETPVQTLACNRNGDPILGYLETLARDPYQILETLGVVAWPFAGVTAPEVARKALEQARPQILAPINTLPVNWTNDLKNQLHLRRLAQTKLIQLLGLQPVDFSDLLSSRNIFYVLDTQICPEKLAYGAPDNFQCYSLEQAQTQFWFKPELKSFLI